MDNLDLEDELAIIKEMIPMANNLPENLAILSLMGLKEIHIREYLLRQSCHRLRRNHQSPNRAENPRRAGQSRNQQQW